MIEKKKKSKPHIIRLCDYVNKCSLDELKPLLNKRINVEILLPLPSYRFSYNTIFVHKGKTPYIQCEYSGNTSCLKECKYHVVLGCIVDADDTLSVPEVVAAVFNEMVEEINETNYQRTWGGLLIACEAPASITAFFEQVQDKIAPEDAQIWLRGVKRYMDYPEVDLWNVDSWFLKMMPKVLDNFKKGLHGFPGHLQRNDFPTKEQNVEQGMKDWEAILDRMGYCFTEAGKDMYAVDNNYDYRNQMKDEGLDLLKKYLWNLWD